MALSLSNFATLYSITLLASACVLRIGDDASFDDDAFQKSSAFDDDVFDDDAFDDDSDVTSGATGGFEGTGGAGGGMAGAGAGGGENTCNDGVGDETMAICDTLAVAGTTCSGYESMGYAACQRGFEIYEAGHAAEFATCLTGIAPFEACELPPVDSCVASMYANACESDFIEETCLDFDLTCAEFGESVDVDICTYELRPFSPAGLTELVTCMNDENTLGDCQARYDSCVEVVFTIDG